MLTFAQNLSRIEHLTKLITLDIEAENYDGAREHLIEIHIYASAATILFEELVLARARSNYFKEDSAS